MKRDFKQEAVEELKAKNIRTIAEVERQSEARRTSGERLADVFAAVVGSWTFIIVQSVLLAIWMTLIFDRLVASMGSISIYPAQLSSVVSGGVCKSHHYDEPKSPVSIGGPTKPA